MTDDADQRRSRFIGLAMLLAIGGGVVLAVASHDPPNPQQPDVKEYPVEQPKPQKKEVAPLPNVTAPAPIVQPERKARGKGMRNKRERTKRAASERPKLKRTASLPSCARIKAAYNRMSLAEKLAAYSRATPEQVAHGRRCLGI